MDKIEIIDVHTGKGGSDYLKISKQIGETFIKIEKNLLKAKQKIITRKGDVADIAKLNELDRKDKRYRFLAS